MLFKKNFYKGLFEATSINQIIVVLSKRKPWNMMNVEIFNILFENAQSDLTYLGTADVGDTPLEKIQNFICFVEDQKAIDEQFVQFMNSSRNTHEMITYLSKRLYSNGENCMFALEKTSNNLQLANLAGSAELSLKYAIICDPLNIYAHNQLGNLYCIFKSKEIAVTIFDLYDKAEHEILHPSNTDDYVSHDILRRNYGGTLKEVRAGIDRSMSELGIPPREREVIPEDTSDEDNRRMVNEVAQRNLEKYHPE